MYQCNSIHDVLIIDCTDGDHCYYLIENEQVHVFMFDSKPRSNGQFRYPCKRLAG